MNYLKMFVCYPDNNIIIDHEKALKILPNDGQIKYVYSYVHLEELLEAKNNVENIKEKRLLTIEKLTDELYVENENGKPIILTKKPSDICGNVESLIYKRSSQNLHNVANQWIVDSNPKFLMQKLGIEKKKINPTLTPRNFFKNF